MPSIRLSDNRRSNSFGILALAGAALALSACSGSTYGTGVTQERQLVSDLAGMVALGGSKKKTPIDYSARSGLVKPPSSSQLPTPAESVQSDSGYFPQNAEETRSALLDADAEDEGILSKSGEVASTLTPAQQAAANKARARARAAQSTNAADRLHAVGSPEEYLELEKRKKAYLERLKRREGPTDKKVRRYLTQPPVEYQQPAQTAAIGEVGEREDDPKRRKKKKKSLLKGIFGS